MNQLELLPSFPLIFLGGALETWDAWPSRQSIILDEFTLAAARWQAVRGPHGCDWFNSKRPPSSSSAQQQTREPFVWPFRFIRLPLSSFFFFSPVGHFETKFAIHVLPKSFFFFKFNSHFFSPPPHTKHPYLACPQLIMTSRRSNSNRRHCAVEINSNFLPVEIEAIFFVRLFEWMASSQVNNFDKELELFSQVSGF